ncbi:MAG: cytochrome c biogenesis protein CcsA, partial [Chloroflexota bacterium]|nr:cytochrome c biogenesis protein CcsA [Chloroflexota bacterium]
MIVNLGYTALLLALLCSFYAIVSARVYINNNKLQWVDSARNAVLAVWFLLTLACLILVYLLTNEHFEIEYVASVSSRAMPWYLKATALWGGQAGSLLFWSWLMSSYTGIVMLRDWSKERDMQPYVITASMLTLAFFISLNVFVENPFNVLWIDSFGNITSSMMRPDANLMFTPNDGAGLNPLLRHPGMIIHPPMLYLGFVGFVIPYSFAIGALAVGRTDGVWIRATRRWTLIAWLFLSLGLLLGGRWAYDVLGWGGYWGWDPVEIAAFMPWLTGTAFLHSVIIQ